MKTTPSPPTQPSVDIRSVRLANGATLLIKPDPSASVVSLNFWVEAGSIDEAPEERGMAHLIEHMIFKGTQKRGVGAISRDVEAAGGYLNAFTSFEHTCFYVVLPSSRVLEALDIELDAYLHSTFDAGELAKEKEVVFEEMRMRRDDPWSWSWELLFGSLFQRNPYHWPVIGDEAVLRAVPREKLQAYYRRHYVPEKTVLCVVGDVDPDAVEAWVRERFEGVAAPAPPPRRLEEDPEPRGLRFLDEPGDVRQYYVSLGFPTAPITHPDAAALEVLEALLSDGGSSRLSLSIREGSRSADEVGADHFAGKYGGAFVFQAVTDKRRVEKLLDEWMAETAKLQAGDVAPGELEKIKNRIKAAKVYEKQSVDGQAKSLGYWQLQGDHRREEAFLAALDAVTAADLQAVSLKYLQPSRGTLLFYRPRAEAPPEGARWQQKLEKALEGARARRPPAAGASKRPPGLKRFTLSDGSTLLVKRRPQVPLVSFGAFFGGGFRDEKDAQAGITSLMTKCLLKGTERLSYADLSRSVEGLAAHIDPVLEKDYWGLTGECLSGRLDETFALFRETLLSPAFRREEVAKEKQMQLAALRRLKDDPADYALLKSDVLTFAGTPYAHPPQGTSGSVSRLSRPEVLAWYGRFLASRNLTWVAVGDVEEERMRRLVEDAARGIPRGKRAPSPRPSGRGAALRSYREKNKGQQANLVLGFRAPHFSHPDYFAFRVMNTLLNGMGGRLFVELREKKSLAYSVYAAHEALAAAGIYQVYIGCAPEKQAQAREGLGRVLADLAAGPIPAEELERAKTYLVGLYQVGQQANRSQLATLARYEMEGLGAEVVQDFPQRVGRVSAGQVRRAAGKYLKMAEANWVVLEPRTRH